MTASRRTFLMIPGLLWLRRDALAMVHDAKLGRVIFCRASHRTESWLPVLLGNAIPPCERIERDEVVLCGTEATMVIDRHRYRRFE